MPNMANHSNIGIVIKHFRSKNGLTQSALAKGVCSIKHIYSIEKGTRNPSAEVLFVIGKKLGVQLSDYYPFLGCRAPVEMQAAMELMSKMRRQLQYDSLSGMRREFECLEDFRTIPWSIELDLNDFMAQILDQDGLDPPSLELELFTKSVAQMYPNTPLVLQCLAVQSISMLKMGCFVESLDKIQVVLSSPSVILTAMRGKEYYIQYKLIEALILLKMGQHSAVVEKTKEIERIETKWNLYEMKYACLFIRAAAFDGLQDHKEAQKCFSLASHVCLTSDRQRELKILSALMDLPSLVSRYAHKNAEGLKFITFYNGAIGRK